MGSALLSQVSRFRGSFIQDPKENAYTIDVCCVSTFSTLLTAISPLITTIYEMKVMLFDTSTVIERSTAYSGGSVGTVLEHYLISETTVLTTGTAWAYPVKVFWHSSDLSVFPSAYAMSLASVIQVPFGNATPASSSTILQPTDLPPSLSLTKPTQLFSTNDHGLSESAKSRHWCGHSCRSYFSMRKFDCNTITPTEETSASEC
jgi:hypothetical protein